VHLVGFIIRIYDGAGVTLGQNRGQNTVYCVTLGQNMGQSTV